MKNLIYLFFVTLLCFSCSNPCGDVNCGPGTCDDGTCECPDGFSGVNCEIEDLCFNSMCENGTCNADTGICDCNEGYEGPNCEIEQRAKYFGDWNSTDFTCEGEGIEDITFNMSAGTAINELILIDVDDPDIEIIVIIDGDNFIINEQEFMDGGFSFFISGMGSYDASNNVMNLSFIITEPDGEMTNCAGSFSN